MRLTTWLVMIALMLPVVPALAQERPYVSTARLEPGAILREEMGAIRDANAKLEGTIRKAQADLEEVARLTMQDEREIQIDQLFVSLREEIYVILDQLDSNSPFSDALNRAREGTLVLRAWYQRQPENYPNRDVSIQQLDQAVAEYAQLNGNLQEGRAVAQEKLAAVIRQHRVVIQQMKIDKVQEALASARAVVDGLNDITHKIGDIETRTNEALAMPNPIPN